VRERFARDCRAWRTRSCGICRFDGDGFHSIQYQNANNSVRLSDEFMRAVENDEDWHLRRLP
jgi:hypothetical protein